MATEKHSVLLVDDEPEILYSLKGLLRREFELYTAECARDALEILSRHPIHVVMTDQRMPEMTGVELAGRIKIHYPETIRIVFTGYADIKAVIDSINRGGLYRYITKPWDPDALIDLLHQATAEYDALVERKQLLRDIHSHIEHGKQLTGTGPDASEGRSECSGDVERFLADAESLLSRLQKAIEN